MEIATALRASQWQRKSIANCIQPTANQIQIYRTDMQVRYPGEISNPVGKSYASIDDFLLFCCKVAEGLKARFDTTHQNFEVFQRGSPLPDGLPNLNGGLPPPADGFPWQPIPKAAILQLRLLRSLPSESAYPITARKIYIFL